MRRLFRLAGSTSAFTAAESSAEEEEEEEDKRRTRRRPSYRSTLRLLQQQYASLDNKRTILLLVVFILLLVLTWPSSSSTARQPASKSKSSPVKKSFKPPRASSSSSAAALDQTAAEPWTVDDLTQALLLLQANYSSSSSSSSSSSYSTYNPPARRKSTTTAFKRRTFGCMRETCRGLEIEDLLDRGYIRLFRSAIKPFENETTSSAPVTYRTNLKYNKVDILLLDTTQLNHVKNTVPELARKFRKDAFVIALEGGDAIGGNKGVQLRRKAQFASKHKCRYDALGMQPAQYRLYVKRECELLLQSPATFLLKPEAGSQGQGITFHRQSKEILDKRPEFSPCQDRPGMKANARFLAQEYISSPLLLSGSKFDLRVYLLALSNSPGAGAGASPPLFSLWYHRGYLRRSLSKYEPLSHDRKAYLTNTHFQSSRENFNMSEHIWTMDQLQDAMMMTPARGNGKQRHATRTGYVSAVLEPHIKEVARFVFESARDRLVMPQWRSNQIIGLDFMLDSDLGVHFIEANGYPGFTWSINFDSRRMVEEMFDLMVERHEAPAGSRFLAAGDWYGGFQLIHSDEDGDGASYNPCHAMGDNVLVQEAIQSIVNFPPPPPPPKAIEEEEEAVSPQLASLADDFLVKSWPACAQFIAPTFRLGEEKLHAQFQAQRDKFAQTGGGISWVYASNSTSTSARVLFPPGSRTRVVRRRAVGQVLPFKRELGFSLERVAYPGGRAPLPTYNAREEPETTATSESASASSSFTPKESDPVYVRARRILRHFATAAADSPSSTSSSWLTYRVKWFFIVLPKPPLLVLSHAGYAYSVRQHTCQKTSSPSRYDTWVESEHAMSLELLQMMLSMENIATAKYVSSVLEPAVRRVVELFAHDTKLAAAGAAAAGGGGGLMEMDFAIDRDSLKPMLLGMRPVAPPRGEEEEEGEDLEGVRAKTLHEVRRGKLAAETMHRQHAVFFARAKRGDAFVSKHLRVVYNALEHLRRAGPSSSSSLSSSCQDRKFPSVGDLQFEIANFALKRQNAIHRDLHKRISKRWLVCRVKSKPEAKRACLAPLLRERYRLIVKNNLLLANEEQWIDDTVQALINYKQQRGNKGGKSSSSNSDDGDDGETID